MRIGIFLDEWRDGGVPVFIDRLERFLTEQGHEVILFLANPYPKRERIPQQLYAELKRRLGGRCVSLDCNSFPVAWRAAHFQRTILSRGISCLLINQSYHYVGLLKTISGQVPLISVAHTDLDSYYEEFLRTMEMTHAHVVVSQRMLQKTRLLAAPERAHRIRQIPYGVEENETYFRPELEGAMRVIYCARLDPVQKRCQDLAPIWKEYIRQGGTGELMILGTGKGEGFLRRELKDEIAEGKVKLRGHVSSAQVLKEMAQSDVLLNVSNFEGLPQVVLEATSLGLYPLLSDIESGHREIVDVLGVGKTCHVGDVARFGRELMELEKNLTLVRSQRGRVRCATLRHYNLADCGLKYLEVIKAVGLAAPVPLLIQQPVRTARQWLKRACLLTKYRRHYRGALG